MGRHKNRTQNTIILEFMEKYPDLARGFTKRDKPSVDSLWQQLTESLNSAGPPQYDVSGWKKKWTEWKSEVRRDLAQNKAESRATGGGPFNKHQTEINEKLDELIKIEKENSSSLRRIYRAIEKGNESVANAVTELKQEFVRLSSAILKTMHEKNILKKSLLDLELQKFDYEKKLKDPKKDC